MVSLTVWTTSDGSGAGGAVPLMSLPLTKAKPSIGLHYGTREELGSPVHKTLRRTKFNAATVFISPSAKGVSISTTNIVSLNPQPPETSTHTHVHTIMWGSGYGKHVQSLSRPMHLIANQG